MNKGFCFLIKYKKRQIFRRFLKDIRRADMEWLNKYIFGAGVPLFLFLAAIMLLIKLRGKPLIHPVKMIRSMFKKKEGAGVSPIAAVLLALAGTLGVGNIVGVASAIAMGGAGAVFWMWVSAIMAMMLKYAEVLLAVLHRRVRGGEYYGGAMYYMRDFFASCKKYGMGLIFAGIFALLCIINACGMGCVIQSNAISEAFYGIIGFPKLAIGAVVAALSALVFFGKGKRIFSVTEKLVPAVSVLYFVMAAIVIGSSIERVPQVFSDIISDAFRVESAAGGFFGFFLSKALRFGTIRGLLSNEAGCGTAPIAHASSSTDSPAEQGFLGILEVFIDTIVLCTMTALVILLNWNRAEKFADNPIMMTFSAFSAVLGRTSELLLCISVFLFAFATIICWGYYGKECIYYFSKKKSARNVYFAIYVLLALLGAIIPLDFLWGITDLAIGVMTLMNIFVLWALRGEVKAETEKYFSKSRKKDL